MEIYRPTDAATVVAVSQTGNDQSVMEELARNISAQTFIYPEMDNMSAGWNGTFRAPIRRGAWGGEISIPLYTVICVLAVTGNVMVILTLQHNKGMRTITNIFLLNLSVSDLMLATFCMPFTLIPTLMRDFIFGYPMCILIRYIQGVAVGVCVFTHVTISLERHFAICQPFRSRHWQTKKHCHYTIAIIWVLSIFIMIPTAVCQTLRKLGNSGAHKCEEIWENDILEKIYAIFLDIVLLVLPLFIMLIAYGWIAVTLFRSMRQSGDHDRVQTIGVPNNNVAVDMDTGDETQLTQVNLIPRTGRGIRIRFRSNNPGRPRTSIATAVTSTSSRARRRSVLMLFVVVLEFFVCWTPLYVVWTWNVFDHYSAFENVSALGMNLIHLLAFVSSCCNPITYGFMSKKFRNSFKHILYKCCPCCASGQKGQPVAVPPTACSLADGVSNNRSRRVSRCIGYNGNAGRMNLRTTEL